jgi:hypothetical protein
VQARGVFLIAAADSPRSVHWSNVYNSRDTAQQPDILYNVTLGRKDWQACTPRPIKDACNLTYLNNHQPNYPILIMASSLSMINVLVTVGNTPCVQLQRVLSRWMRTGLREARVTESTGSYKDRMARSLTEEAEQRGDLRHGMTVVEATGSSTGSALAFVYAVKGYRFHVVSSNAYAVDKLRAMAAFGAEVDLVNSPSGRISRLDPSDDRTPKGDCSA